jgi:multiple sugar transport system ATP-binding protein
MARVVLRDVSKSYPGGVHAVRDFNLEIADGELVVFVGPSGCGKSTTLRMIAGLEEITGGTISIGDRVVNDVPPKDRDIAMVFQSYALYPHMTVFENMAFGLKMRKVPAPAIAEKVRRAAAVLGLEPLLERKPRALSGGQRQRVAVGRAMVRDPQCFLFDEPLSNLDAKLRVEMRAELKRLHLELGTTTVYVTHDQEEAMTLGDRIVVMKDGVIQQVGTPLEIYHRPVNRFVAGFLGTPPMNFLEGTLVRDGAQVFFEEASGRVALPADAARALGGRDGGGIVLGIRPTALSLDRAAARDAGTLEARVLLVEPLGDKMDVTLATGRATRLVAHVDAVAGVQPNQTRPVYLDLSRAHFFEPGAPGPSVVAPVAAAPA